MTFLDFPMMAGIVLLSIPVVLHLINRRKAKQIPWGAMRFLSRSFNVQRRRLLVEDIVLLVLRCLLIASIVTAMARPFISSQGAFSWAIIVPLIAVAAICAGASAVMWNSRKARYALAGCSALAAVLATSLAAAEKYLQESLWDSGTGGRDIAIVIDGSDSMRMSAGGRSNFDRARDEAVEFIGKCGPGDAIGLVLAGPLPYPLAKTPISDHRSIVEMIRHKDFRPSGGSLGVLESLNAAAAMLAEGSNPAKRIVLFTDQQRIGWDIASRARWNYLEQNLKSSPVRPKLIVRRYPFPQPLRNASIAEISFSNSSPGAGQTVTVQARIANGGDKPIQPSAVSLSVDGENLAREIFTKEIPAGSSETVSFRHRFARQGRALVACSLECVDDLAEDNTQSRVIDVCGVLPVLVIDGAPARKPALGAADFIRLALRPSGLDTDAGTSGCPYPIRPDTVGIAEAAQADLAKYRVIILADPPLLPKQLGDRLLEKVRSGCGLLVAPGPRTDPESFNRFRSGSGEKLMPADLSARIAPYGNPAHFALKTFTAPALRLCADTAHSDAPLAIIHSYWKLEPDKNDRDVSVGGLLDSGDPFYAERKLGRGFSAMTSFSLGKDDSSLASLKIFVPLMHEIAYHLASSCGTDGNVAPGTEMIFELDDGLAPSQLSPGTSAKADLSGKPVQAQVATPSGKPGTAEILNVDGRRLVRCSETRWPGLHKISLAGLKDPPKDAQGRPVAEIPFVVIANPEESSLARLSGEELASLSDRFDLFAPADETELMAAASSGVPGKEICKWLMAMALLFLVLEVALERRIAKNRRLHEDGTVEFAAQTDKAPETFASTGMLRQ